MEKRTMDGEYLRNRAFFWLAFLVLIILAILLIRPYFTVIVVSLIAVIMLTPLYNRFLRGAWVKGREKVAVSLTLASFVGILLIPIYLIARLIVTQLAAALSYLATVDLEAILEELAQGLQRLPLLGDPVLDASALADGIQTLVRSTASAVTEAALTLGTSLPSLLIQGLLFVVLVAAVLPRYKNLVAYSQEISPLGREISALYERKITAMISSLIKGVFLIAIIQGAAMGIFYWLAGLPWVFLLSLLSMLLAMIPLVGISWLVIALSVIAALAGNYTQALILLFGFYGVVNWIDILLRPRLLSQEAYLPIALFLLSIFGGIAWAGVMGLFYGPIIMLLLLTTIEIYAEEYAPEDGVRLSSAIGDLVNGQRAKNKDEDGADSAAELARAPIPSEKDDEPEGEVKRDEADQT
jgi:predicted PurR-regulated permease PerM